MLGDLFDFIGALARFDIIEAYFILSDLVDTSPPTDAELNAKAMGDTHGAYIIGVYDLNNDDDVERYCEDTGTTRGNLQF